MAQQSRTKILLASMNLRSDITVRTQLLYEDFAGRKLANSTDTRAWRYLSIRPLGGSVVLPRDVGTGKSQTLLLSSPRELYICLTFTSTSPKVPKNARSRTILLAAGIANEAGRVTIRQGSDQLTVASGPLRRVWPDEAAQVLGRLYDPAREWQENDYRFLPVSVTGMTKTAPPNPVTTRGEHGGDTIVYMPRKPRRVSL